MSLCEMIGASHDDATQLVKLTFTEAATSGDPRRALRAADTAVAAISAHMYSVQTSIYPVARRRLPDSRPRIAELCAQGRETSSVLRGMSQHIQGDVHRPGESMRTLRERLAELEEQHIAAEDTLVADLEQALSPDERRRLVTSFRRSMRRAPTRPHPYIPRTAVVGGLALRFAGSWDHVLDTMDARVAAGGRVRAPAPAGLWGWYLLGRPVPSPDTVSTANPVSAVRSGTDAGSIDAVKSDAASTNGRRQLSRSARLPGVGGHEPRGGRRPRR
ncbi:hemerythrin domain-containing protein [Frankia sp. Cr2]|uniref:hemerythrin domain-containing protein n=1 Tax=Frankia sp. Cr2 TaxID=3073932 RepID=UPI002AD40353|nr:hemerythrin domain-containing protein [Frankia sp. Cr2]